MSARARCARRLASLLTKATGVHVVVRYRREHNHYSVEWNGGPNIADMRLLALQHQAELGALDLSGLTWSATDA